METIITHVDQDNFIVMHCPYCGKTSRVSVTKFKGKKHTITTRCKCKYRYKIQLNFRRYYRKSVKIVGEVLIPTLNKGNIRENIIIYNLSMTGLRFSVVGQADLKKGETVRVKFDLGIKHPMPIDKEAIVRFIGDDYYGCEFKNLAHDEKMLGFFLFGK